jgi:hypothetical protein
VPARTCGAEQQAAGDFALIDAHTYRSCTQPTDLRAMQARSSASTTSICLLHSCKRSSKRAQQGRLKWRSRRLPAPHPCPPRWWGCHAALYCCSCSGCWAADAAPGCCCWGHPRGCGCRGGPAAPTPATWTCYGSAAAPAALLEACDAARLPELALATQSSGRPGTCWRPAAQQIEPELGTRQSSRQT